MKVHTETGSIYEFRNGRFEVRRIESTHDMRGDGEWIKVYGSSPPEVGYSMRLALAPLADDADVTYRTTSRVTHIEEGSS